MNKIVLCFGNQLFDPKFLMAVKDATIVLVEDEKFCRKYAYHKQKLIFILAAMRSYAALLRRSGFTVKYFELAEGVNWRKALSAVAQETEARDLLYFEVENPTLGRSIAGFAEDHGLRLNVMQTPMFLSTLDDFAAHMDGFDKPFMLRFYKQQRARHDVLMDTKGEPLGGKWSFDHMNRKKLPKNLQPQEPPQFQHPQVVADVTREVEAHFSANPGDAETFWLPVTHADAQYWLENFLEERLWNFGLYEDALSTRSSFVYHSGLAPLLNVGLLTPKQVLDATLDYAERNNVPLNSVEGFVRQVIGWREFVRGIFHHYAAPMQSRNIWNADRSLTSAWYTGTTGMAPLDHVIAKTHRYGWAHHIERLMVAANLMNLVGVQPQEVYRWFMEMFVDAYDWVMVPNVFGMGLTSEGGIFTTKPYICGSNYVLKMGDYGRGDWCDVMDGLLWRFVANHEQTLKTNHRLAPMIANLDRVSKKRPEIFSLAETFIESTTIAA